MCAIRVFAFQTIALQAALTVPFFTAYAHKVLIEGYTFNSNHIGGILASSIYLGRHSRLIVFTRDDLEKAHLTMYEYTWTHHRIRPNGDDLGRQCPDCGALHSMETKTLNNVIVAMCSNPACKYKSEHHRPKNAKMVSHREAGQLMVRVLPTGL